MQRWNRRSTNIVFSAEFVGAGHAGNARTSARQPKTVEAEVDGDGVMRGPAVTVMNSSIFDATSVSGSSTGPTRRTEKQSAPRHVPHSSRTSHADGCGRMPVPRSRSHLRKNAGTAPFNFGAVAPPQPAWVRPAGALHLPIRPRWIRWWPWSCAFRDAYCRERALKVSHFIDALEPKPRPDAPS